MTVEVQQGFDAIELAIFSGRLNSICDQMGEVLKKTALSPNIKDRLDFSCAFFDDHGLIVAQAAHIPVHLGSMAFAMKDIVSRFNWFDGDLVVLNDPFMGGTHLPDVTIISPLFHQYKLLGFVANRAHHANIGSDASGSMPLTKNLSEEGVLISPCKLLSKGVINLDVQGLLASVDSSLDQSTLPGDFQAQLSANQIGCKRLSSWLLDLEDAVSYFELGLRCINRYGHEITTGAISKLPEGRVSFIDFMDGDGFDSKQIPIKLELSVLNGDLLFDFSGTSQQVSGNINCPESVCAASVYYVVSSLLPSYVPHCHGVFKCIKIMSLKGSLLNADAGAAVSAGNVETSMRIVDVVLGAFSKLGVDVPAASQGTMNNVAMGGLSGGRRWDYYETIGGGGGAGSINNGLTASQCHMTNTLNTPIESLELHYPIRIKEYAIRSGSGGDGFNQGGDGIKRTYEFTSGSMVTLLTERRSNSPWGLSGGGAGLSGSNWLNGRQLAAKTEFVVKENDQLLIMTPGGGGWGE